MSAIKATYFKQTTLRNGTVLNARLILSAQDAGMRTSIPYGGAEFVRARNQRSLTEVVFFEGPKGDEVTIDLG